MLELDILDQESYERPNWAEFITADGLEKLGRYVKEAVEVDEASREDWIHMNESWIALAQQVLEEKNYPWPRAASVKFPLLTTAALQFHARAHQELLKDERIVMAKVIGKDDGEKAARARRVEDVMSLQFLYRMNAWQDDMDRLLYVLPLVGTVFKKVYWDDSKDSPASELVLPSEMVVAYYADDWERARKTHLLYRTHNEVVEQQRMLNFRNVDLSPAGVDLGADSAGLEQDRQTDVALDSDVPHELLECHCWYDLDDDGYEEPYIVTVDKESEQVLRVVPRFRASDVRSRVDGVILRIEPLEYVVPYKFFPAVDSNTYGTGFGSLLGPLNSAVNSVINQIIDAGTLANQQSGFIGRGVRISKGGSVKFKPGEWKETSATGDDLRKGVFPLPVQQPNPVLFNLLNFLVDAGKQVSSVAEVMQGQNPGQNQPFSTTATVLEQGMQVFLGIYKRVYRSLTKEYSLIYNLNFMKLTDEAYNELGDFQVPAQVVMDFAPTGLDIVPEADPNMANSIRKQARVQALIEAQRSGMPLNKEYVQRQFLEAINEPNIEEVMKSEPPPPSPEQLNNELEKAKLALEREKFEFQKEKEQFEPLKDESAALLNVAKAQDLAGGSGEELKAQATLKAMDGDNALAQHIQKDQQAQMAMEQNAQKQGMAQEAHGQKMEQLEGQKELQREKNASPNKPGTSS